VKQKFTGETTKKKKTDASHLPNAKNSIPILNNGSVMTRERKKRYRVDAL
jgi:hypothetical protein